MLESAGVNGNDSKVVPGNTDSLNSPRFAIVNVSFRAVALLPAKSVAVPVALYRPRARLSVARMYVVSSLVPKSAVTSSKVVADERPNSALETVTFSPKFQRTNGLESDVEPDGDSVNVGAVLSSVNTSAPVVPVPFLPSMAAPTVTVEGTVVSVSTTAPDWLTVIEASAVVT